MWWWPRTAISKAINHNRWQMQCFLGLSLWLHAGRGRSAKLNVAFCGCWQQRWRCAIGTCHSTLVWWLNKANRQCRQGETGQSKGRAEGRQESSRNSDRVGQKTKHTGKSRLCIYHSKNNTLACIGNDIWKGWVVLHLMKCLYFHTAANSAAQQKLAFD